MEWERLAMEFKQEAFEYKMKFKDKWTNKNVGLLSKARPVTQDMECKLRRN